MSTLDRLDDRSLADIGIHRGQIADYAHEVAHRAIPVAPMPKSGRISMLARLKSWWERRAAIRELSTLDDRLLRDVGIEPGQVGDVVDALLSRRRYLGTAHPAVQLLDVHGIDVPVRYRPGAPAMPNTESRTPKRSSSRTVSSAERTPDIHALRAAVANEHQTPERRYRASGGM